MEGVEQPLDLVLDEIWMVVFHVATVRKEERKQHYKCSQ